MNFETWLKSLPGAPTPTVAANKAGLTNTTLIRHAERGRSTADNVIVVARAYGVSPVDALVDNGFLRLDEVAGETISTRQALARATMDDILQTLVDKLNQSGLFEGPVTLDDLKADGVGKPDDDLAQHRKHRPGSSSHPDIESLPYVADSTPDEPEMGDDGYHDGP